MGQLHAEVALLGDSQRVLWTTPGSKSSGRGGRGRRRARVEVEGDVKRDGVRIVMLRPLLAGLLPQPQAASISGSRIVVLCMTRCGQRPDVPHR